MNCATHCPDRPRSRQGDAGKRTYPRWHAVSGSGVVRGDCVRGRGLFPPESPGARGRADLPGDHDHAAIGGRRQSRVTHQLQRPPQRPAARRGGRSSPVRCRADGAGTTQPLVGLTGRLTCSYGIPSPSGGCALQLSAETYRDDAAAAAARIPENVDALRSPGTDPTPIKIGPTTAMYLPLREGPYLIASTGIYSVPVTLGPTSFTPDKAPATAAAVAALVLTRVRGGTTASAVGP